MISLDVERLTVRYGRAVVLRECSMRVEEGQAVGVFGAHGAGK
jgi:ABC-type multidrug transport system ATPase subunit